MWLSGDHGRLIKWHQPDNFQFIVQFNTKGATTTAAPFPISPEPQGSFLCGLRCQPNGNLIGKVIEKSGNAWYNGSIMAVSLPYKSEVDEDYYEL